MSNRKMRYLFSLIAIFSMFAVMVPPHMAKAAPPIKERAPVAQQTKVSHATMINSDWIEIILIDTKYNNANVTNTNYYTITSTNDSAYSSGIHPALVHYRYFPEQAPYYPNYGDDVGKIQVSYSIFLKVPSGAKLQEGKTYTISINSAVVSAGPFMFTFDQSAPNLAIHSNQVGYLANGSKVAYLSFWTGQGSVDFGTAPNFQVVNEANSQTVYTGNIVLSTANDRWSQSDVYKMDFTSYTTPGTYHLYIPTVGRSYSFKIDDNIYLDQIAYTIIRGITMQRDGDHGLDDPDVTHWTRPPAHLDDAIDQALYLDNGGNLNAARIDLVGGHMDAGDRGKYPYNSAYMSATLLAAARYFPDQIEALGESLDLPESNNGKPDFLDELVYELDWLYKAVMNTSTDGTLPNYLRPGSPNATDGGYEQGQPPEGVENRVFYNRTAGPNKAETLFAAGALAMAYNTPIMQQYFPSKVSDYLTAAQKAYNGFKAHYQDPNYLHEATDYDTSQEGTPHTWSNEMLFAASNLMQATGNTTEYMSWITSEYPANPSNYDSIKHWTWMTDSPWVPTFVSLYENPLLSSTIRDWAYNGIIDYADFEMNHQTPFGASMQDEGFPGSIGWRFASAAMFPVVIGYGVTQDTDYLTRIQSTWNYELGTNAVSRSFITGLGDPQRSPRWMVNEIGQYQFVQYSNNNGGWAELPPGLPNADLQSAPYPWWYDNAHNTTAKSEVYPSYENYPPAYRYTDSWNTSNEYVIADLAKNAASMLPLIPVSSSLPTPGQYQSLDITTSTSGSTSENGGNLTIQGSGAQLWSNNDSFRYVYQNNLTGDVAIVAKLDSFTATNNGAMAGIMIRQGTEANANYMSIGVTKDGQYRVQYRNSTWTALDSSGAMSLSVWLKLEKTTSGSNIILTAYTSTNGTTWTQRGQQYFNTALADPFTAGLFVSANQDGTMGTAGFSNITWPVAPVVQYQSVDITTSTTGSTSESGGNLTIQGSGSQLWSNSDSFRYVYKNNLSGDAAIVAKLDSFTATNNGAMTGIMIRQGTAANANYMSIGVTKDGQFRVQYRNSTWTSLEASGAMSLPVWLKLEKTTSGSNIIVKVYTSANGTTWTLRGQQYFTTTLTNPFTAGLFVSANQDGTMGTAGFSNISWP